MVGHITVTRLMITCSLPNVCGINRQSFGLTILMSVMYSVVGLLKKHSSPVETSPMRSLVTARNGDEDEGTHLHLHRLASPGLGWGLVDLYE